MSKTCGGGNEDGGGCSFWGEDAERGVLAAVETLRDGGAERPDDEGGGGGGENGFGVVGEAAEDMVALVWRR